MNQNSEPNTYREKIKNKLNDSRWAQFGISGFNGFLDQVARRLEINIETFLVGSISLVLFAIALLFDQLALFVLALLIAPILSPILAPAFGITLGSFRFLKIGIISLLLNIVSFFIVSAFAGFIARQFPVKEIIIWRYFLTFNWAELLLLVIGIMIMVSTLIKNPRQASLVANVALAYSFYLPLISAGFAFGLGYKNEFINAIVSFLMIYFIAIFCGVVILLLYKIRPQSLKNAIVLILFIALLVLVAVGFNYTEQSFLHNLIGDQTQEKLETSESNLIKTETMQFGTQSTEALITLTKTQTLPIQIQIEETPTSNVTINPTSTLTITLTPLPEVVWAEVQSPEGNGANIRQEPGYSTRIVRTVLNGTALQVLNNVEVVDGVTWVRVRFSDGIEGWIMRNLIVSATPEPQW